MPPTVHMLRELGLIVALAQAIAAAEVSPGLPSNTAGHSDAHVDRRVEMRMTTECER